MISTIFTKLIILGVYAGTAIGAYTGYKMYKEDPEPFGIFAIPLIAVLGAIAAALIELIIAAAIASLTYLLVGPF